ncbi:UvrD-helicase domain-containing protein [Alteribacillus sp. HJP-4]|uniref:UvrD-helicase domain-containing protein n=1 Tax=Alteribacillus sp. HJP-4 TaxID=2775394 RepID=UPI0035CD2519
MLYIKRIIQAGAGTGKTTLLINEAQQLMLEGKVLYLTFTRNNLRSMKEDIVKKEGIVPQKIECRTWIEFLLNELAKPYRKMLGMPPIEGLDNTRESEIPKIKGVNSKTKRYYINKQNNLYSERLAQFVVNANYITKGCISNRIQKMYSTVLIDEIQDLNGHDLEVLRLLYYLDCNIILVGDHRQSTYSTNTSRMHTQYKNEKIFNFFITEMGISNIESLNICYRCNQEICDFVNPLFNDLNLIADIQRKRHDTEGIYLIDNQESLLDYVEENSPTLLYYDRRSLPRAKKLGLPNHIEHMTFGNSKGLTRNHVLIFPTKNIKNHAIGRESNIKGQTLAKYYVALTRAKHSVAIYIG